VPKWMMIRMATASVPQVVWVEVHSLVYGSGS
jgi:hypothetical protein